MELSKQVIETISNVLKVARTLKLSSVSIESEIIRGMNDSCTVMICDDNVPDLPFKGMGIGRVDVLIKRLGVMNGPDTIVTAKITNDLVMQLDITAEGSKFEYRCTNPNTIKSPRRKKDPNVWQFTATEKTFDMLMKAAASISAELLEVRSNAKGEITITIEDGETRDKFVTKFDGEVVNLYDDDGNIDFVFTYKIDVFLIALRAADVNKRGDLQIVIGQLGGIKAILNNTVVYIMPTDKDAPI